MGEERDRENRGMLDRALQRAGRQPHYGTPMRNPDPLFPVARSVMPRPAYEGFLEMPLDQIPERTQDDIDRMEAIDLYGEREAQHETERLAQGPFGRVLAPFTDWARAPETRERIGEGVNRFVEGFTGGEGAGSEGDDPNTLGELGDAFGDTVRGVARSDDFLSGASQVLAGAARSGRAISDWWGEDDNQFSLPYRMGGASSLFSVQPGAEGGPIQGYLPDLATSMTGVGLDRSEAGRQGLQFENARIEALTNNPGQGPVALDTSMRDSYADEMTVGAIEHGLNLGFGALDLSEVLRAPRLLNAADDVAGEVTFSRGPDGIEDAAGLNQFDRIIDESEWPLTSANEGVEDDFFSLPRDSSDAQRAQMRANRTDLQPIEGGRSAGDGEVLNWLGNDRLIRNPTEEQLAGLAELGDEMKYVMDTDGNVYAFSASDAHHNTAMRALRDNGVTVRPLGAGAEVTDPDAAGFIWRNADGSFVHEDANMVESGPYADFAQRNAPFGGAQSDAGSGGYRTNDLGELVYDRPTQPPSRVFHGTTADVDEFAPGSHFGTQSAANQRLADNSPSAEGARVYGLDTPEGNYLRVTDAGDAWGDGAHWAEVARTHSPANNAEAALMRALQQDQTLPTLRGDQLYARLDQHFRDNGFAGALYANRFEGGDSVFRPGRTPNGRLGEAVTVAGAGGVGGALLFGDEADAEDAPELSEARGAVTQQQERLRRLEDLSSRAANDPNAARELQAIIGAVPDGRFGPETAREASAYRDQLRAELTDAEARLERFETDAAAAAAEPDPGAEVFQKWAPLAALTAGAGTGHWLRGRAVSEAARELAAANAAINARIPQGNVPLGHGAPSARERQRRAAQLNELWVEGGAGERVPFRSASNAQGFARNPNTNVAPPSELFSASEDWFGPESQLVRPGDVAIGAGGLIEGSLAWSQVPALEQELEQAEAAAAADPTSVAAQRLVEDLRMRIAIVKAAGSFGLGIPLGRATGAASHRYQHPRPDVAALENQRMQLDRYLAETRPPPRPRVRPEDDPSKR